MQQELIIVLRREFGQCKIPIDCVYLYLNFAVFNLAISKGIAIGYQILPVKNAVRGTHL